MSLYRQSFLFICVSLIAACGTEQMEIGAEPAPIAQKMIINGEQCEPNKIDSTVELFIDVEIEFEFFGTQRITSYLCGGTLIAPDVVLTAAHCLDPSGLTFGMGTIKKLDYYIIFDHDLSFISNSVGPTIPKDAVLASSVVMEEAYDGSKMEGPGPGNFRDIGLVFLSRPLDITPAVVITKDEAKQIVKGTDVTIAGWGQRTPNEINPEKPEEASLTGQKYCAKSQINEVGNHEIQVGSDESSSRKCFGDSGGPTYMNVVTAHGVQNRVIGITSHAYDDAVCHKGGIDTRVDAWLEWVDGKMREGCAKGTRSWCKVEGIILPDFGSSEKVVSPNNKNVIRSWLEFLLGWFR